MFKNLHLESDSIFKLFLFYFFPALVSMLSMSTQAIIDGFFVGQSIGKDALKALGLTWPVFPMFVALHLLFSIGGSTLVSYYLGKKEPNHAREIFSSVVYCVLCMGVVLSLVLFIFTEQIAVFLGATPNIKHYVVDYLEIIFLGTFVLLIHPVLDLFVINDEKPILAMISMLVASVANVIFNYVFLFVFNLGIYSSALSTIIGGILAILILLWHFLGKKGELYFLKFFDLTWIQAVVKNGFPAFASEISISIVILLYNRTLMDLIGERGVLIYTIVMYGGMIFFTILLSIAQATQPITSFNYGANQMQRVRQIYQLGLIVAFGFSCVLYILFYCFGDYFILAFLDSSSREATLVAEIHFAMRIWFLAYFAMGINLVSAIFLQSVQRPLGALILTLCYTIIFVLILLPTFVHYFGVNGVWGTYPASAFLALLVLAYILKYEFKKGVFA